MQIICTIFFLVCNIIIPLRPLLIKIDLDEKNFLD